MAARTAFLIICITALVMNVCLIESAQHTSEPAPAPVLIPQLGADCSALIISMIDCLSYITARSTVNKPQGTCCSSLKTVLETDAHCVCEASKQTPKLGMPINITKALALPAACHVNAPSPAICGINLRTVTAPVGSPQTAFDPLAPTSASQTADSSKLSGFIVLGSTIGTLLLLVGIGFIMHAVHKRKRDADMEEEYPDQVPGMPSRFSYDELKTATENFSKKLGEGGYGSVFEGTLGDDTKIAVKCLEGGSGSHVKKSFVAEVQSIGSIHHVNLVRLMGFCTRKSQRFLVYDFMSNGSLDRWIYHGVREQILEWECRKKIILDIAKGLAYLHEECRQKIVHLDIKPQNILLDSDFNAKVSDFGLSKLIDKNQTQVMSTIKGTPGYIAPEWRSSIITEKMDVYSFGIVLLEILCGRKIFSKSEPEEESWYLLSVFQKCWEQGTLLDMVDRHSEDMQVHNTEVVEMMKVASWCLQTNYKRRPSMSSVVKVLEGVMNVESNLDYNFTDLRIQETEVREEKDCTRLSSSFLSGPR